MSHKQLFTGIVLIVILVALAATATMPARAQDRRLRVVASFSILADVAQSVAGDAADVASLMPLGTNPHAFTPSAQDVVTLSKANTVLVVGVNFEEGLLPVVEESAADKMFVVSQCIPIRPVVSRTTHNHEADHADEHEDEAHEDEGGHDHHADMSADCAGHYEAIEAAFAMDDHALLNGTLGPLNTLTCGGHDHEADDANEGQDDHEHAAGSCDPHVWTDPVNAGLWALMIRDVLAELDPANADVYAANAEAYLAELAALHRDIQALIDAIPADRRSIVTNHLAFNYFSERYGLKLVGVVIPGGSTTSEPSVQEVLTLIDTVQEYNVPAIFTETTVSESIAQQIAGETGAQIVRLYTGSLSQPGDGADTYLNYMRYNAQAIADALK